MRAAAAIVGALAMVMAPVSAEANGSGVFGRAAWRGQLVPGVVVYAYRDGSSDFLGKEAAKSGPTALDGTYRLALEPGRYVLVARSGDPRVRPLPGEYYCFYSGSPVVVTEDGWSAVGLNLVKVAEEVRSRTEKSSIEGAVTYRDEPMERLYLYLYRDASDSFRGPGLATLPVGAGGRFRAVLSPGRYFVIARKRARGGLYGPMEIGDYFNYYPGNPVEVGNGETVKVLLETVTRISQLEEGENRVPVITGTVTDDGGRPVGGLRVLAYRSAEAKGRPVFFSEPSTEEGRFVLPVPEAGSYILVAREKFGGPAVTGERYGQYNGGEPLEAGPGFDPPDEGIAISVRRQP